MLIWYGHRVYIFRIGALFENLLEPYLIGSCQLKVEVVMGVGGGGGGDSGRWGVGGGDDLNQICENREIIE